MRIAAALVTPRTRKLERDASQCTCLSFFAIAPLILGKSNKSGFVSLCVKDKKIDASQKLIASGLLFRVISSGLEHLRKKQSQCYRADILLRADDGSCLT